MIRQRRTASGETRYQAILHVGGRKVTLGTFATEEQAQLAEEAQDGPDRERRCMTCARQFEGRAHQLYCSNVCRPTTTRARFHTVEAIRLRGADCRSCEKPAVALHHIIPKNVWGDAIDDFEVNMMPLCSECHLGWHHRRVTISQDKLKEAELAFLVARMGRPWLDANYPPATTDEPVPDIALLARRIESLRAELAEEREKRAQAEAQLNNIRGVLDPPLLQVVKDKA